MHRSDGRPVVDGCPKPSRRATIEGVSETDAGDGPGRDRLRRVVVEALRDGFFRTDAHGAIVEVNNAFCTLVGREEGELLGLTPPYPWWLHDPETGESPAGMITDLLEGPDEGIEFAATIVSRDGHQLRVGASVRVLRDVDGKVTGCVGMLEDVSDRSAAQGRADRLSELGELLARSVEEDEVLDVILDGVMRTVPLKGCGLFLPTIDGGLEPRRHRGMGWTDEEPPLPLSANLPITRAFNDGTPFFFADRAAMQREFPEVSPLTNVKDPHARATLPLLGRRGPAAVLHLLFPGVNAFPSEERTFLLDVATRCGLALERASLYEGQRRDAERAQQLQEAFATMAAAGSPEEIARIALHDAVPAFSARAGSVALVDEERSELSLLAFEGTEAERSYGWDVLPLEAGLPGTDAVLQRTAIYLGDRAAIGDRYPDQVELSEQVGDEAWAALPLMSGTRPIGLLFVNFPDAQAFDAPQRLALESMADRTASAIGRARRSAYEHDVAVTLQHSLLPVVRDRPSVRIATRYETGARGLDVGGDWYDSIGLPDGRIAFAVGDVVGRGLEAAATMGHLRSALGALALRGEGPGAVLEGLDEFARAAMGTHMATVAYVELSPTDGTIRYACAGHPPPILVPTDGPARTLDGARSPLLEMLDAPRVRPVATARMDLGDTLVLYTDGLTERRNETPDVGIDRLLHVLDASRQEDPETICDILLRRVAPPGARRDDIAILCARRREGVALIVRAAAAPDRLAGIRADVGTWLHDRGIGAALREDLVLAVAEASANAVEHAYRDGRAGDITIEGSVDRDVVLRIVDRGTWRYGEGQPDRGRGMHIMRSLVDDMEVFRQREGTTIVLRKQLSEHE
jgi:PAS domain S-box-containing protein